MKCFNHHDRDAFGICSVCGKGLCLECMEKINDVIVCKNPTCKNKAKQIKLWKFIIFITFIFVCTLLTLD